MAEYVYLPIEQSTTLSGMDWTLVGIISVLSLFTGPQMNICPALSKAMEPSLHWIFKMFLNTGILIG